MTMSRTGSARRSSSAICGSSRDQGDDQVRVRFDARYDTGAQVIDETDEITLRRRDDGTLIIIEQRTV
jgi:hypothetical protein